MNKLNRTSKLLKKQNRSQIVKNIFFTHPTTRLRISRTTDLSAATVTNLVSELIQEKIISESGSIDWAGGRPTTLLSPNSTYGYFIGIDVGETQIQYELFDFSLKPLFNLKRPITESSVSAEFVINSIISDVNDLLSTKKIMHKDIVGLGVGLPGVVDQISGISVFAPNWGWRNIMLAQELSDNFNFPVYIDNGAKGMALAEAWFGAGKGLDDLAVLLIGTGVGAGIITEGHLYRGISNSAGEWGHTKIERNGRKCRCGSLGCLEAYIGAPGIIERYQEEAPLFAFPSSDQTMSIQHIIDEAQEGNQKAQKVIDETSEYLGIGISNLINLFDPQKVIIGGWVGTQIGSLALDKIISSAREYSLSQVFNKAEIGLCKLGPDAVALGAATLAFERFIELV